MSDDKIYPVPAEIAAKAHVNAAQYEVMYKQSIENPDAFWAEQAEKFVTWFKPWDTVTDWSFDADNLHINWFKGGKLNVSYNCLDRHLEKRGDQVAIIWEGDNPAEDRKITYRELHAEVCKFANVLKARGVKKGDRVCIYLPMIPEAAVAMLACTRVGAAHSIVFGGFSPDSLRDRIIDSDCRVVITADESMRGGRSVPLKKNADTAVEECGNVGTVVVVRRTGGEVAWKAGRDVWYHEEMAKADPVCEPEQMDAEDPLFILYTSGSTGKPKGVMHTTGGYLVYRRHDPQVHLRLPGGRNLLVHGGRGLGHRPHLHRLRPAGQWRHLAHVRGDPQLPGHVALLAGGRQAPGQHLLHRPHRHPLADALG